MAFGASGSPHSFRVRSAPSPSMSHGPIGLAFGSICRSLGASGDSASSSRPVTYLRGVAMRSSPIFGALAGGLAAVGLLSFAWRNGQLVSAVEQIAARVAFPAFSRLQSDQVQLASAARISLQLSVVAVCLVQAWVISTADVVIPLVFSDAWTSAVVPLQIVCLGSIAGAPTYVLRSFMYAGDDGRRAVVLTASSLVILVVSFPILAAGFALVGASWAFTVSAFAGLLMFIRATRGHISFPWTSTLRVVVGTAAAAIVAGWVVRNVDGISGVVISGCVYLGLALIALRIAEPNLARMTVEVLKRGSQGLVDATSADAYRGCDDASDGRHRLRRVRVRG